MPRWLSAASQRHVEEWRYRSNILDLSSGWRRAVSFMCLLLYPWGKSHQYQLARRLDGPQSWSGCYREGENLVLPGNRTMAVQPVAHHYTDWAKTYTLIFLKSRSWNVVRKTHIRMKANILMKSWNNSEFWSNYVGTSDRLNVRPA
jgi:hypothetical protein